MARPPKQTVDYFPHDTDASEGKTLTIIQAKYGNDGYAFWFKLLQLLGKTPGHYYDFNNPADWEFLLAKTHQNGTETTKHILETLVILGAIDAELYAQGVIWCQKFVDRVEDAYNRTVGGPPARPDFSVNVNVNGVSVSESRVTADSNPKKATEIPQTKLKESKVKETVLIPSDTESLIFGQTPAKAIMVAQGKLEANPRNRKAYREELDRRGIKWKEAEGGGSGTG
ncbi:hypothetical protein LCGC14_0541320 [marine sediment metagenome]|uniref:Lin1244/Lin1753-like N-terminal domain-containing protein n=1 Tax=marine sediment metagenome TaxID=412755 RepID=A0A0F9V0Y5_9ZZZZ